MTEQWIPVSHENCAQVRGPFYHGTRAVLSVGDVITTGHVSHFEGRALKHVYFSALLEPAIWGAELAMALSSLEGRGRIYRVEPTGPFEDDPNLTNKRFPGNPTQSYRTRDPLRIVRGRGGLAGASCGSAAGDAGFPGGPQAPRAGLRRGLAVRFLAAWVPCLEPARSRADRRQAGGTACRS